MNIPELVSLICTRFRRETKLDPVLLLTGMILATAGGLIDNTALLAASFVASLSSHIVALREEIDILGGKLKQYRDTLEEASQDEVDFANNLLVYAKEAREMKEIKAPGNHTTYQSHMVVLNPDKNSVDAVPIKINPN